MRQALTMALQDFEGAIVVVSHDRHLLRNTVDEFWLVNDGGVTEYQGDLEDYERWLADRRKDDSEAPRRPEPGLAGLAGTDSGAEGVAESAESAESADDRKARKRAEAAVRQKLSPWRKRQSALEREMETLQGQLAGLETELSDPAVYEAPSKARLTELLARQAQVTGRLGDVEAEWLEVVEAVEAMESELAG